MKFSAVILSFLTVSLVSTAALAGEALEPDVQAKLDAQLGQLKQWATDPALVAAVRQHNSSLPPDDAAMTQDKWRSLTVLDPFVRSFSKNAAGQFLKSKKTELVGEAFVSGSDGLKVGFLNKSTNWSHKGSAKHETPMKGGTWQGKPEIDESSGLVLVQVSVPVLDGGKPIGSLVVGLVVSKLK
ncbi:MAG TPA: hypothetical protein VGD87_17880 [Archangium sp.]